MYSSIGKKWLYLYCTMTVLELRTAYCESRNQRWLAKLLLIYIKQIKQFGKGSLEMNQQTVYLLFCAHKKHIWRISSKIMKKNSEILRKTGAKTLKQYKTHKKTLKYCITKHFYYAWPQSYPWKQQQ